MTCRLPLASCDWRWRKWRQRLTGFQSAGLTPEIHTDNRRSLISGWWWGWGANRTSARQLGWSKNKLLPKLFCSLDVDLQVWPELMELRLTAPAQHMSLLRWSGSESGSCNHGNELKRFSPGQNVKTRQDHQSSSSTPASTPATVPLDSLYLVYTIVNQREWCFLHSGQPTCLYTSTTFEGANVRKTNLPFVLLWNVFMAVASNKTLPGTLLKGQKVSLYLDIFSILLQLQTVL